MPQNIYCIASVEDNIIYGNAEKVLSDQMSQKSTPKSEFTQKSTKKSKILPHKKILKEVRNHSQKCNSLKNCSKN